MSAGATDAAVLRDDLAVPERYEGGFVLWGRLAVFGAQASDVGPFGLRALKRARCLRPPFRIRRARIALLLLAGGDLYRVRRMLL